MYKIIPLLLLFLSFVTHADIYKFYDENGNVVFTDHPEVGAEKIKAQPIPTISSRKSDSHSSPATTGTAKKKAEPVAYTVAIISPKHDTAIRANDGIINVDVGVEPALDSKKGHLLTILLDGKVVGEAGTSTSFTLDGLDRGQHSIAAKIVDEKGDTVASASTVSVNVQRISILHPKPANPAPGI